MHFRGSRSWQVSIDTSPTFLHAALYVREACGIPVAAGGVPPPLLVAPPPSGVVVRSDDWHAWWESLIAAGASDLLLSRHLRPATALWPLAPPALLAALEPLGDEPLRWVSWTVDDSRFQQPAPGFPVQAAVRRLEREFGRRSVMQVNIAGLAVAGDWVEVHRDGSTMLASWSALDQAEDWLTDALREAFRRS